MKKVALNLDKTELQGIMQALQLVIQFPDGYGYGNDDEDKFLLATLTELYYKLNNACDLFKAHYKIKISIAQAMAFTIHFKAMPESCVPPQLALTITTMIGTIDQQQSK